jgi:hypothetical protein
VAYHTTGCTLRLCFTKHLIAKALDIVHRIRNDYRVRSQVALDGRRQSRPRVFLTPRSTVYISLKSEILIVQVVDLEFGDARIF